MRRCGLKTWCRSGGVRLSTFRCPIVRGYNPGQGKYAGMVGSLQMELPDGKRFSLGAGLTDRERRMPPPMGSLVTFKHQGWTAGGKPRFPVYWRVRELPKEQAGLSKQGAP